MPTLEGIRRPPIRQREVPPAQPEVGVDEEELSEEAIRAIEEGRADLDAGRTVTMAEIKREFGIDS